MALLVVLNEALGEKPALQTDGTYLLAQAAMSLRLYRNGLRQSPGDDYRYDATTRTIAPTAPWDAADRILADYTY